MQYTDEHIPSRRHEIAPWLVTGGVLSLLLHGSILLLMGVTFSPEPSQRSVIDVQFVPPLQPKEQIVRTMPSEETTPRTPETLRLSDKNSAVEREQMLRGDGLNAGIPGESPQRKAPSPAEPRTAVTSQKEAKEKREQQEVPARDSSRSQTKTIQSLRLSQEILQSEFGQTSPKQVAKETGPRARELLTSQSREVFNYVPFSRPFGSGAQIFGEFGSNDFLPNLPDGDITLLNAKASKFAVFVQRVATRVFSTLRSSGWGALSQSDIRAIQTFSTIRAVLSPEGTLIRVTLETPSGSRSFDEVLQISITNGASDPHPPEGARAADGNIHFIFKAKSWSQVAPSRGGNGIAERRWLLLATGLE
jgi:hypothetical protein